MEQTPSRVLSKSKISEVTPVQKRINRTNRTRNRTRTGIREFHVIGVNCVTTVNNEAFFFLFADVDTKDEYVLKSTIKYFVTHNLDCFWYETSKGYHVFSSVLLDVEQWDSLRYGLGLVLRNYYRGINLRISKKSSDPKVQCPRYDFSFLDQKYLCSDSLLRLLNKRFRQKHVQFDHAIKTKLKIVSYKEIEI